MKLTKDEVEALKAKHGTHKLYEVEVGDLVLYLKHPSHADYERLMVNLADIKTRPYAQSTLVEACVVHPPLSQSRAKLHEKPFLFQKLADMLGEEMGSDLEVKKSVL